MFGEEFVDYCSSLFLTTLALRIAQDLYNFM